MGGYRLYFMDRFTGHIEHRREFFADDDAEAMTIAQNWSTGQPMELWEGEHKLKRWETETISPDRSCLAAREKFTRGLTLRPASGIWASKPDSLPVIPAKAGTQTRLATGSYH